MYNAYGSSDLGKGGIGTTPIHLDMADAVNIMMYASMSKQDIEPPTAQANGTKFGGPTSPTDTTKWKRNSLSSSSSAIRDRIENRNRSVAHPPKAMACPPCAAVWDIYQFADLPKIRQFLHKVAAEKNIEVDDPVHDQMFYLNDELRKRLRTEYGVIGWRIYQNVGDAVFVPAGCAHQVCNYMDCIKVSYLSLFLFHHFLFNTQCDALTTCCTLCV
jgi:lysine-specific demethylase 3